MKKEDVDKLIAEMPDVIDMGKAGKWRKENLCKHRNWHKTDKNTDEYFIPIEVTIDGVYLNPQYDIVHVNDGNEYTPLLDDFMKLNQLVSDELCEIVHLDDDDGLLLKKVDNEAKTVSL